LGSDIAGTIESLGSDESALQCGDEVYGVTNPSFTGGYAEYAIASLDMIAPKPQSLNYVEAASAPVVSVTAWQMLFDKAHVVHGQTVLVLGAAGNVGGFAVQFARNVGARVIALADGRDASYLTDIGASVVVDYRTQAFETVAPPVDAVIDLVGGETQKRAFQLIKPGGSLISSVAAPSKELAAAGGIRTVFFIVRVTAGELTQIAHLFDSAKIRTEIGAVLPLARAREAHEMLSGSLAHARGKIVLEIIGS
jgi:NADPH:quinone reductase-like Zn-dependent oxidoreductase